MNTFRPSYDRVAGMHILELEVLGEIIREYQPKNVLEIGMANASSSVKICSELKNIDKAHLTSVDPYQTSQWHNRGIEEIERAGFSDMHTLIQEPDYIALPQLISQGRMFDFIFIDGFHSFDYTFIDIFLSDLLLRVGGILAIHDTYSFAAWKACRYLETNRPYKNIGPPIDVEAHLLIRVIRRCFRIFRGPRILKQAKLRRTKWRGLAAYIKQGSYKPTDLYIKKF